jgi:two-component system chemotaxis response regulator CheB
MVVDDAAASHGDLAALLRFDPQIDVAGETARSANALALVRRIRPDVIAMGIHLPAASGFATTKEIMINQPTPVVLVSDERHPGEVELSILALRAGALAVVPRPAPKTPQYNAARSRLVSTVKAMSQVKVVRRWRDCQSRQAQSAPLWPPTAVGAPARVIAIAASTGGPAALQHILAQLPADFPVPILVVQHISAGFVDGLASYLDSVCSLRVKVAECGERLSPHTVYMAPADRHLGVCERSRILLVDDEPVDGFRPSATFLFASVSSAYEASAVHVILTGMGRDGVVGLQAARRRGGKILAQDETSSVVFGMPGAAIAAGVVDQVLPLALIARALAAITAADLTP